jgi:DNA-binding MarR family transcriptional regulator
VRALEAKRFLVRGGGESDRRVEILSLSPAGRAAYRHLAREARRYDDALEATMTSEEVATLRRCLARLAAQPPS